MVSQPRRAHLFDRWAGSYDAEFTSSDAGFPFDGYDMVLREAVRRAAAGPGMRVLDLGISKSVVVLWEE